MHKLACSCELNPDTAEPMTITHKVRNPIVWKIDICTFLWMFLTLQKLRGIVGLIPLDTATQELCGYAKKGYTLYCVYVIIDCYNIIVAGM